MKDAEDSRAPRPLSVHLYDSNRIQVSAEIVCACIPETTSNFDDFKIVLDHQEEYSVLNRGETGRERVSSRVLMAFHKAEGSLRRFWWLMNLFISLFKNYIKMND